MVKTKCVVLTVYTKALVSSCLFQPYLTIKLDQQEVDGLLASACKEFEDNDGSEFTTETYMVLDHTG